MKAKKIFSVLVALPLAAQDGRDKYNGILRYLAARKLDWSIQLVRYGLTIPLFKQALREGVDGMIVDCPTPAEVFRELAKMDIPCVSIDTERPELLALRSRNLVLIDIDSRAIGNQSADYLRGQSAYSSFGFLGFSPGCRWSDSRAESFAATLSKHGVPCETCFTPRTPLLNETERKKIRKWLSGLPKPAALLTANDELARTVLAICQQEHFNVPDDIAVLGVDNEQIICAHIMPSLSSVQPDFVRSGFQSALWMDKMLRGKFRGRKSIISPILKIVARESTAPASPAGKLVIKALEFIRANACKGINVKDVVRYLRVSRRLIDLRFRQITGRTVLDCIQTVRLEQIQKLLRTTTLPIARIGAFCSENYMKRLFKRRFGVTMRDYRKGIEGPPSHG